MKALALRPWRLMKIAFVVHIASAFGLGRVAAKGPRLPLRGHVRRLSTIHGLIFDVDGGGSLG
jgi:hypothetical protein